MRGSKALKLLIYCLWSIFVIGVHARWAAMVLSRAAEHRLCTEVAGNLFLPPRLLVLPGCCGQGWGELAKAVGPEPGWKCLIPVSHPKPAFPFRSSCLALAGGAASSAWGLSFALELGESTSASSELRCVCGTAGSAVVLLQSWAELIVHKSQKWIPLAFSSVRLGWGSHTGSNFAT